MNILKKVGKILQMFIGIVILLAGITIAGAFFIDIIAGIFGYDTKLFSNLISFIYSGVKGSSDAGKVLKDMGAGTYYVRACRYTPGPSTCDLYSNQITVTFP